MTYSYQGDFCWQCIANNNISPIYNSRVWTQPGVGLGSSLKCLISYIEIEVCKLLPGIFWNRDSDGEHQARWPLTAVLMHSLSVKTNSKVMKEPLKYRTLGRDLSLNYVILPSFKMFLFFLNKDGDSDLEFPGFRMKNCGQNKTLTTLDCCFNYYLKKKLIVYLKHYDYTTIESWVKQPQLNSSSNNPIKNTQKTSDTRRRSKERLLHPHKATHLSLSSSSALLQV